MIAINFSEFFKQKYSSENWKKLLSSLFTDKYFYKTPIEKKDFSLNKHADVESIRELGDIELSDKSRILLYEIELKEGKSVTRNRVGLRNLIHTEVIPGDVDGILATYYNPKAKDWRLTFISKSLYWDEEMNEIKSETHPKRYTYVLGENESIKTAERQFEVLFKQLFAHEITINDLIKLFSVGKVSKEFFDGYRHLFKTFEEYITDNKETFRFFKNHVSSKKSTEEQQEEAERLIRNFVKKMLGRIVFIYFLQKKGWLGVPESKHWGDGELDFISKLFTGFKDQSNFYAACLVPLFFDTLNSKRDNDIFTLTQTKIPYLNGGLFDKDKIETITIKFKPQLFGDLFAFFDQYNFTIDENSPDDFDIGIDPEMLGLIFENLLEDNKDKGTFYTPKEVVHFMCKESLALHTTELLKNKLTEHELKHIEAFVRQNGIYDTEVIRKHTSNLYRVFTNVKICDPAIGSGAFPMGMVYEILRLKKEIFGLSSRTNFNYRQEKLDIIRNSIYGVDLDKGAVDIARLRFWLSLIVDEEEPAPLPNLDYKIMQGDSLKEYFEDVPLDDVRWERKPYNAQGEQLVMDGPGFYYPQSKIELTMDDKIQLNLWVEDYFKESNHEKKEEIHKWIDQKVIEHIESNVGVKRDEILELKQSVEKKYKDKGIEISEQSKGKDFKAWQKFELQVREFARKTELIKTIQEGAERPWFMWNLFFGDILLEGNKGFDIVIGNPPYGVKVDDEVQSAYGLGSKDSYGAFMSMALKKLVKTNGILSFIVSDTWLTIKSHFELREQVLNYQLKKIIRLHQDCFKATVNSCIFTLQKTKTDSYDNVVIAADLTNISTRREIPEFRDKLFHLEILICDYTPKYAVYCYPQSILSICSSKPVIIGSPKLFQILNDLTIFNKKINEVEISCQKIKINETHIELAKFEQLADVKKGIDTGYNQSFIFKKNTARGSYRDVEPLLNYILTEADLKKISQDNDIKSTVISKGINKLPNDCLNYFSGKYIIPYEKGGASDVDDGWLPNYFVENQYFIDWSEEKVLELYRRLYYSKNQSTLRNMEFWFKPGLTFSLTGIYAPTIRIKTSSLFDNKSSGIFSKIYNENFVLGILCSKFVKYILKNYIMHTVDTQVGAFNVLPFILQDSKEITELVDAIIIKQKKNQRYNYYAYEQKEIDKLVYELYGLNAEDINEVETWFARRYPKLADYAYFKPHAEIVTASAPQPGAEKIRSLIAAGESKTLEFKSSLRFDLRENKAMPHIEHSSFKNLAAFLNTEGGTLLFGVEDNGNILGLEKTDFPTFKGTNKKDEFLQHFDNLVKDFFGNVYSNLIHVSIVIIDGKTVAVVEIKEKASGPIFLKIKGTGPEEFYIRRNASVVKLTMYEFYIYSKNHWKTS